MKYHIFKFHIFRKDFYREDLGTGLRHIIPQHRKFKVSFYEVASDITF